MSPVPGISVAEPRAALPQVPTLSLFAPIISGADIELAVVATLQAFAESYLAEVARQRDLPADTLPLPRSWVISAEVEKMPEDQTPAVIVASPGLVSGRPPTPAGDGSYTARWQLSVSAQCLASGAGLALRNARWYAAALRACLLQQQGLGGLLPVSRIEWTGESYNRLPSVDDRTTCVATVDLVIEVGHASYRNAGPLTPTPGPQPDTSPQWPTAQTALVALQQVPLQEVT